MKKQVRPKSYAFCGGAYGDEGKGRIVDQYVSQAAQHGPVVVYRDNGGANAGHNVVLADGQKIALHQLPSGVFVEGATVILGKEMVVHPGDLLEELKHVEAAHKGKIKTNIKIDEMTILSLDTHRAFEAVLKMWQSGGKGSTGRGIAPAYADVLLRHPLRVRDLFGDKAILEKHYDLYEGLISGLGQKIVEVAVPTLEGATQPVGTKKAFVTRVQSQAKALKPYVENVTQFLTTAWNHPQTSFVFEKAQAVGLDTRWGVYPDVTASDTTFGGIFSATEGIVDPQEIEVRAAVIKATYMSSVGSRVLPTAMKGELADRIREDAHEYGATTKRPRDIAYLDLPALRFFSKVGRANYLVLTHMDITYPDVPVKVCVRYEVKGKEVPYRPDQAYLNTVTPIYEELPSWDQKAISKARQPAKVPAAAQHFMDFVSHGIGLPILMITTGPAREQGVMYR